MDPVLQARRLADEGRFSDAIASLQAVGTSARNQPAAQALRAELLERLGRSGEAASLIEKLLRTRGMSPLDRSRSYYVLGRIEAWKGNFDGAVTYLQRSIGIATEIKAFDRLVLGQCRLLLIVSDSGGLGAGGAFLSDPPNNAGRNGGPRPLAAV